MKHDYPAYYAKFRCIAADCPDSCCQGWDVVIDEVTEAYYQTVEGSFGEKLRRAVYTDQDGDRIFYPAENQKCPFWGTDKLCDIYKELGEEHLCETCAQFPRLRMDYGSFTEHSLALACPEAARLALETDHAYDGFTQETVEECEDYDAALLEFLLLARRESARLLTAQRPLDERLRDCLRYNAEVQRRITGGDFVAEDDDSGLPVELYAQLEYIDDMNRERITGAYAEAAALSAHEAEWERLALYYLYRYYLTAIESGDVVAPIRFMIASVRVIAGLADREKITPAEAAQMYSKEVEQSYENMEMVWEIFSSWQG